jgi:hypothetical protein
MNIGIEKILVGYDLKQYTLMGTKVKLREPLGTYVVL